MARLKPSIYYYNVYRKNICKYRIEKGLTQQQLADLSELSNITCMPNKWLELIDLGYKYINIYG